MRRHIATATVAGMALAAMLAGGPAAASPASAADGASAAVPPNTNPATTDDQPCERPFTHQRLDVEVQYCPDWAPDNSIPVNRDTRQNSRVVGRIHAPGKDWYVCQLTGGTYRLRSHGYANDWWAFTMADNGEVGFVNEVYFRGGRNFEKDAGLEIC